MLREKLQALLSLTRPPNSILMYIAVIVGIMLSDTRSLRIQELILSFITAYGLCGSSMGFNDYFDREVDKVNAPWRPIPSGKISEAEAIILSSIIGGLGLAAAAAISPQCFLVAVLAFSAALIYNARLKKTGFVGNLIVSFVVVIPFIYGAVLADGYISAKLITFILPAYLSNLGREVIKGISDVEGDALRDVRSVARIKGRGFAAKLGAVFYLVAVFLSPLPYLLRLVSWLYLPLVAAADAGFIWSAYSIVVEPSKENSLKVKNLTLVWMLIALAAFLVGSL